MVNVNLINNAIKELPLTVQEELKEKVQKAVNKGLEYEDTHLHSKDQFLSDNSPGEVIKKYKELGRTALFLTQHGVAAMTWDFQKATKSNGLKFIPGLETDYQPVVEKNENGLSYPDEEKPISRFILHALNDQGWKAIGMAISASQTKDGKTLMSNKIFEEFFAEGSIGYGNVVATTSSIEGYIPQLLKKELLIKERIQAIKKEQSNSTGGDIPEQFFLLLEEKIEEVNTELVDKRNEQKELKKIAKTIPDKMKKEVEKALSKFGEESVEYADVIRKRDEAELEKEKALPLISDLDDEISRLKNMLTALKSENKAFKALQLKNEEFKTRIERTQGSSSDEQTLIKEAENELAYFDKLFGHGFFFVEIQNHFSEEQQLIFPKLVELARKQSIPIIASNDVLMIDNSEEEILKRAILKTTKDPKNPKWEDISLSEAEMYIKSASQMKDILGLLFEEDVVEEAMLNTILLTEMADIKFISENHHPKFVDETGSGKTSLEAFKELLAEGISRKFPDGLSEEHQKRLEHEAHVMETMGYVDYHLIVNDFNKYASEYDAIPFDEIKNAPLNKQALIEWKKEKGYDKPIGLTNGTGRGSAVGSLVCDLLDITHLDPLKYELLFERFLNPERVTMPDIDSDISRTVRPIVIQYLKDKYGEKTVAGIITQNAQAPRGAVRIAAKAYGLYLNKNNKKDNGAKQFLSLADKIAKSIPTTPGTSFSSESEIDEKQTVYQQLLKEFSDNSNAVEIIKWSKAIEGVINCKAEMYKN